MNIIDFIPEGKANAIHQKDLVKLLNISADTIKKLIQQARKDGAKIISGQEGYWVSDNEHDFEMFERMMNKQAKSRLYVTKCVKKAII